MLFRNNNIILSRARQAMTTRPLLPRLLLLHTRGEGGASRRAFLSDTPNTRLSRESSSTLQNLEKLNPERLLERLITLDKKLSYEGWHTLRWIALAVGVGGVVMYIFKEDVNAGIGDAASEVTRRTLEDQGVQDQAKELSRAVVYELLNDQRALELSTIFVNRLLARDDLRSSVLALLLDVLGKPEIHAQVRDVLLIVLSMKETRDALVVLFQSVFQDDTMKASTAEFFRSVLESNTFVDAERALSEDTVRYLLDDESLKKTVVVWLNAVLNEPELQQQAGQAAWGAVKAAFGFKRDGSNVVRDGTSTNRITGPAMALAPSHSPDTIPMPPPT